MTEKLPAISVVMCCYNEEIHLGRAIESLQAQTFADWELILIDDGSTDGTAELARIHALADSRIRLVRCGINLGLPACLNIGVFLARTDLIARADADDVNLPERLERQFDHMRLNPHIDVLGTGAYLIGANGERRAEAILPGTQDEIEARCFQSTPFFHPSVMIRRRFFDQVGVYDVRAKRAQDRELWLRGLQYGAAYANLNECLIEYTTNDYRKSWKIILRSYRTGLYLTRRYKIQGGFWRATLKFIRSIFIKIGVYHAKSIRVDPTVRQNKVEC